MTKNMVRDAGQAQNGDMEALEAEGNLDKCWNRLQRGAEEERGQQIDWRMCWMASEGGGGSRNADTLLWCLGIRWRR